MWAPARCQPPTSCAPFTATAPLANASDVVGCAVRRQAHRRARIGWLPINASKTHSKRVLDALAPVNGSR
jgi:hypothetical protein